jgi:hypothetical protein
MTGDETPTNLPALPTPATDLPTAATRDLIMNLALLGRYAEGSFIEAAESDTPLNPRTITQVMRERILHIHQVGQDAADYIRRYVSKAPMIHALEGALTESRRERDALRRQSWSGAKAISLADEGFAVDGFFVYCLWGADKSQPLYVGRSANILSRLGNHLSDSTKRPHVQRVTLIECETRADMRLTETKLIAQFQPPWNTLGINEPARKRVAS